MSDEILPPLCARIDGKVYCNLKSRNHFQFVDRGNVPVGPVLLGMLPSKEREYQVDRDREEIFPESSHSIYSGLEHGNMITFRICEIMNPDLLIRMKQCQRNKKIDIIVVDTDVMRAARKMWHARKEQEHEAILQKLWTPVLCDPHRHRFYLYGICELEDAPDRFQDVCEKPNLYRLRSPVFK